jgi:AcrR family transcriptional regulator
MLKDAQTPASHSRHALAIPPSWPTGTRSQLMAAIADVVASRGYAETRVSDLLVHACISRRTFYRHFDNLEECFFAAYEAIREDALAVLTASAQASEHADDQVAAAIDGLLARFAAWPAHALLLLVHVSGAGPVALAEHERTMGEFARRLVACFGGEYGTAQGEPHVVAHAVIGAMQRLVQLGLASDSPSSLPRMGPALTAVALRMAA